jgi:hypothetical protein
MSLAKTTLSDGNMEYGERYILILGTADVGIRSAISKMEPEGL